jgi:hypothetical protein
MTTETTAFMIGYGFFTLITALLVFAWRKESRLLATAKEKLIRSYDEHEGTFKRLNEALSEKQILSGKNVILEIKDKEQDKLFESLARINSNLLDANNRLESELDRGNEMITWMKADLEKAHELNRENEMAIMDLLIKGKFPDEKGVYRKNYLSKKGENLPLGEYIDSLYCSKVVKTNLDTKRKLVALSKETITFDDFLKSPDLATGHMKSVIEIKPDEPLHDFDKIADQATQPLAGAIDWNVPQAFPNGYAVPKGTRVIALTDGGFSRINCESDDKGTVVEPFNSGGADVIFDGKKTNDGLGWYMYEWDLAPINPTDHPLHPEFGKEKEEKYDNVISPFYIKTTKQDIENSNDSEIALRF